MRHGITLPDVTVKVEDLVQKLKANYKQHVEEHEEAVRGFREHYLEEIGRIHEIAKQGDADKFVLSFRLTPPTSFEGEYLRAIRMLDMSTDTEIELTAQQFDCFVMDNWEWKEDFLRTASMYNSNI